jgi:hypothetical protein
MPLVTLAPWIQRSILLALFATTLLCLSAGAAACAASVSIERRGAARLQLG